MAAARALLESLLASTRLPLGSADSRSDPSTVLPLGWPSIDALLPDGGFPRGVVELSAPRALGGATTLALASIRAAHARDARAWCAWIDPEQTLYAPGLARAGVDLLRLLVVRPPRAELGRVAVKVAASGAFDVVVVDVDPLPLTARVDIPGPRLRRDPRVDIPLRAGDRLARKLALASEQAGAIVVLITDSLAPRALPWPVALRLELVRPSPHELSLRVAKDRRGRVGIKKTVAWPRRHEAAAHAG